LLPSGLSIVSPDGLRNFYLPVRICGRIGVSCKSPGENPFTSGIRAIGLHKLAERLAALALNPENRRGCRRTRFAQVGRTKSLVLLLTILILLALFTATKVRKAIMRHFDHGYAVPSHRFQSFTAERVLVNADIGVHLDLLNSRLDYVSNSHVGHEVTLFTNDMTELSPQLSADISKTSALETHSHLSSLMRRARFRRWIVHSRFSLKKSRCQTMTHDYKRNGKTTSFAALNVANGEFFGPCQEKHRHQEWLKFLRIIDQTVPTEEEI
jgi:hypothetical protein